MVDGYACRGRREQEGIEGKGSKMLRRLQLLVILHCSHLLTPFIVGGGQLTPFARAASFIQLLARPFVDRGTRMDHAAASSKASVGSNFIAVALR